MANITVKLEINDFMYMYMQGSVRGIRLYDDFQKTYSCIYVFYYKSYVRTCSPDKTLSDKP